MDRSTSRLERFTLKCPALTAFSSQKDMITSPRACHAASAKSTAEEIGQHLSKQRSRDNTIACAAIVCKRQCPSQTTAPIYR